MARRLSAFAPTGSPSGRRLFHVLLHHEQQAHADQANQRDHGECQPQALGARSRREAAEPLMAAGFVVGRLVGIIVIECWQGGKLHVDDRAYNRSRAGPKRASRMPLRTFTAAWLAIAGLVIMRW